MNAFYFGESLEFIEAEYARSNRSSCKGCKGNIAKQELRFGLINDDDHMSSKYYYHVDCFRLFPRHKELTEDSIDSKIYGLENLEEEDLKKVKEILKKCITNLREGKKATKKQAPQQTKNQAKIQVANKKKKTSKGRKSKKDDSSQDQSFQESESEESVPSESDSQDSAIKRKQSKPKKQKGKGKVKNEVKQNPYTTAQNMLFQKYFDEFNKLSLVQLKQLLGKNKQPKTGVKKQLAQKCADGKILGQIPSCFSCGGGRLRFDRSTGIYTCPGYRDDTDYVNCHKKFELGEIARAEWIS